MKRSTQSHNTHQRRRGATLVEISLVVPIFFVLLLTGIEFAVLGTIRSTANNAAYEAARKLVVPGASASRGIQEADRIMAVIGVRNLSVQVTPQNIDESTREVTVQITIPYAENAIFAPWFTGGVVIRSHSTLLTERYGGVAGT